MTIQSPANSLSLESHDNHGSNGNKCQLHTTDYKLIEWLEGYQRNAFDLFKVDVTFNSSGSTGNEIKWLQYYDEHVVHKIHKNIGLRQRVNCCVREYEFNVPSRTYRGIDWRNPHHIHAIVAVPSQRA